MTTEKLVFSKLFPKTELGTHKVDLGIIDDAFKSYNEGYDRWVNSKQNLVSKAALEMGFAISKLNSSIKTYDDAIAKAKDLGLDYSSITKQQQTARDVLSLALKQKEKLDSI